VAFPTLPSLPALPAEVDPDRWLGHVHGQAFARTVQPNGDVVVDHRSYSIQQALAGRQVVLQVRAPERVLDALLGQEPLKVVPIKGLVGQPLPFEEYAARLRQEARSEYRRWLQTHRGGRQAALWAS
jgi:hypothetical protein